MFNEWQVVVAPAVGEMQEFLRWWSKETALERPCRLSVDLANIEDELKQAAVEIIKACGHMVEGSRNQSSMRKDYDLVIFSETIFADVETRWQKLRDFLDFYRLSLRSIAEQREVYAGRHIHFTYVSVEKTREILVLSSLINRLNASSAFSEMRLVLFQHPEKRDLPPNGHIDYQFTPSRFGKMPRLLFEKAVRNLGDETLFDKSIFMRCALDDDDVWLPWAMQEMSLNARALVSKGGRPKKSLGFPNQFLYYPSELGRVDCVRMAMVMTGSKVHIGNGWEHIVDRHPWSLPESFSSNMQRRFRHIGVDLCLAVNNRPLWVYVRRAGRLSATTKFEHYRDSPSTMTHIGDDHSIIRTAELIDQQFERRPIDFGIDPPTLEVRAELLGEKRLRIRLNLTEMVEAYDLTLTHLTATVNWGDTDGRYELDVPVNAEIEVDPTGWTERTRLVLEDSSTGLRFSSWVRGKEIYLS